VLYRIGLLQADPTSGIRDYRAARATLLRVEDISEVHRCYDCSVHGAKLGGGYGSGLLCDGCDAAITSNEQEQTVAMPNGRTLRLHVPCHGLWRALKESRQGLKADCLQRDI
jgi:hypothetical protein